MICTQIIPCWIWCCSYAIQYKINWISMQSVVKFTYLLHVGAVGIIHMMTLLVSQIFIVGDNIPISAVA